MTFTAPKNIRILSDNNEIELVRTIKIKTGDLYQYKFIFSITKMGLLFTMTENELNKNLKNFFKII
jgi:hypothetical protein